MRLLILLVSGALAGAAETPAIPAITNWGTISKNLRLSRFKGKEFRRKIKVAVLDNGFNGYADEIGKTLPKDTIYHKGKDSAADRIEGGTYHGLLMARILAQALEKSGATTDVELHLFNSFGYTKFKDAAETVTRDQFDLVLYSQVWEFGGNGDGRGFINGIVSEATRSGIIWINAAGNFGKNFFSGKVDGKPEGEDEFVVFQHRRKKNQGWVSLNCSPPPKEKDCGLRLVLAWNDFKDDADTGTDKDLDLVLQDASGKAVATSERRQVLKPDLENKNSSMVPRELIEQRIKQGSYRVRVKIISKNFSAPNDRLRLTASGQGIALTMRTEGETLLPPADHPDVITVGASDDRNSSRSDEHRRPDLHLKSLVQLKDGSRPYSTSTAAAMAAAVATLHLGIDTDRARTDMLAKLRLIDQKPDKSGQAEAAGAAAPTPPAAKSETRKQNQRLSSNLPHRPYSIRRASVAGCLQPVHLPVMHGNAAALIRKGGISIMLRGRPAIMVPFNLPRLQKLTVPAGLSLYVYSGGLKVTDSRNTAALNREDYEVIPSYSSPPVCPR